MAERIDNCVATKMDNSSVNSNEDTECSLHEQSTSEVNSGDTSNKAQSHTLEVTKDEEENKSAAGANLDDIDPYAYTKTDAFTSEIFKVEIQNIPKFFGIKQLKKKLGHINVKPCKVKMADRATYAFVTFRNDEERENAIKAISGQVWKNRNITAKKAKAAADPMLLKRKMEAERDGQNKKMKEDQEDTRSLEERLKDAVTSFWRFSYEEQLEKKENFVKEFLKTLNRSIEKENSRSRKWLAQQRKENDGFCCKLLKILKSPVTTYYRNKCEFTIGQSIDGKDKTIGFRLGAYKGGHVNVASPEYCDNVPRVMVQAAKLLEEYCQTQSELPGFNPETKRGNWRQITVRTTLNDDIMVVVQFHKEGLAQEKLDAEKARLKEYCESEKINDGLKQGSFYFEVKGDDRKAEPEVHHLCGDTHLYEPLLDLKFRISPTAFFQVNTLAAEVLYSTVADWADINENTILLDVCCGTGTIGLTMAKRVKQVIGIEMCREAVEDAKFNASLNGIENMEFHCGKAEAVLPKLIKKYYGQDVVAVVDPPRGGLHPDVVIALRNNEFVKRLVYVSCSPNGAKNNIIDLTREPSRRVKGSEFRLIQAVAVDLFPQTPHYELVMQFQRYQKDTTDTNKVNEGAHKSHSNQPKTDIRPEDNTNIGAVVDIRPEDSTNIKAVVDIRPEDIIHTEADVDMRPEDSTNKEADVDIRPEDNTYIEAGVELDKSEKDSIMEQE